MANIKCECAAVLCRLLEAAQTNEDPSSFQNSGAGQRFGSPESNGNSPLSLTSMSKSGGFTCCVPVLPTIKEIQNYTLPYIKELCSVLLLSVDNSLVHVDFGAFKYGSWFK
jgi:hypothetical protein